MCVRQPQHDGVLNAREMTSGDFVSTHLNDFWCNILEVTNDEVKVKGFCTAGRNPLECVTCQWAEYNSPGMGCKTLHFF